jgi:hypothetical protein
MKIQHTIPNHTYIAFIYIPLSTYMEYSAMGHKIDLLSQHSSSIVSICLSFDNDYGTILSYWNKNGNNVGNIEAMFLS